LFGVDGLCVVTDIRHTNRDNWRTKDHLVDLKAGGRVILKLILINSGRMMCVWLQIYIYIKHINRDNLRKIKDYLVDLEAGVKIILKLILLHNEWSGVCINYLETELNADF
jgi:hypothetical protein